VLKYQQRKSLKRKGKNEKDLGVLRYCDKNTLRFWTRNLVLTTAISNWSMQISLSLYLSIYLKKEKKITCKQQQKPMRITHSLGWYSPTSMCFIRVSGGISSLGNKTTNCIYLESAIVEQIFTATVCEVTTKKEEKMRCYLTGQSHRPKNHAWVTPHNIYNRIQELITLTNPESYSQCQCTCT
jgi:hypothetical protein